MQLNFDVNLLRGLNACLVSKSVPLTVLVSIKLCVALREWCSFVSIKKKKCYSQTDLSVTKTQKKKEPVKALKSKHANVLGAK